MGPSLQCKQLSHWLLVIQQISWCSECLWPVWPWSIWILAESYGMRHQENYTSYLQGFRVKAWMLLQITSLLLRNSSWISVGQRLMFCLDGQSLEKKKIWRLMRSFGEEVFGGGLFRISQRIKVFVSHVTAHQRALSAEDASSNEMIRWFALWVSVSSFPQLGS